MKIIQFRCPVPEVVERLKVLMIEQVNTWSRLQRLADDPEYVTQPFNADQWRTHQTDPALHWADWDAIYSALGDDGRTIADQLLGTGPLKGILRTAPLVAALPDVRLEIVEVADIVAAGYAPAATPPADHTQP